MNLLYPKLKAAWLPAMLGYAAAGALIAGGYGIVHDELTYSIGPDYFTQVKFGQFHYADFGWPRRVFVAEIGFLATWWVGAVAGWFLSRVAMPRVAAPLRTRSMARAFGIVFALAVAGSLSGYAYGLLHGPDYSDWLDIGLALGVLDLPGFVRVAYIHNASYAGAGVGLAAAVIYLFQLKRWSDGGSNASEGVDSTACRGA